VFDVNHGFAFTVRASARIPAAPSARRGKGEALSVWVLSECPEDYKSSQQPSWGLASCSCRGQTAAQRRARWLARKEAFCT